MRRTTCLLALTLSAVAPAALAQNDQPGQLPQIITVDPPPQQPPPSAPPPLAAPPAVPKTQDRAQDKTPVTPPLAGGGRYTFNRVEDGLLRLDNKTGQITYCSAHTAGWSCQAVPEERAALEKEISRLREEVATLKKELAALIEPPQTVPAAPNPPPQAAPPAPQAAPPAAPDKSGEITIRLPTHDDYVRARAYVAQTWRRLVDMIADLKKDVLSKG